MHILHAGILYGSPVLWAESSDVSEKQSQTNVRRYGFGARHHTLQKIFKSIGITSKLFRSGAFIWLPTRRNGNPIPSVYLADDSSATKPKLKQWAIDVIKMYNDDLMTLLCMVMGRQTIIPGIIVGADLQYISDVMRMAGAMVAGQQYLPDISKKDSRYTAAWSPVLTAAYSQRFEALANSMPGSVWAIHADSTGKIPNDSPQDILLQLLTGFTSAIVRHTVKSKPVSSKFDSIHDSWMHKLTSPIHSAFTEPDAPQMLEQTRNWHRPITVLADSPLRLCFRLEEPDVGKRMWFIRYIIQSRDDPSLMMPAADAWKAKSSVLSTSQNIKEFLLASLGQASGIFPKISTGMDRSGAAWTKGCAITKEDAYNFLTGEASALEQAGYGVMFPSEWTGKGTKTRIKLKADVKAPVMKAKGILDFNTVVSFAWEVAIGDKNMSIRELQRLANAKSPLVNIRGKWMLVNPEEIQQAIKFLKKKSKDMASIKDMIMMNLGNAGVGGMSELASTDIEITSKDSQIKSVLHRLNDKTLLNEAKHPDGFSGKLRPYQLRGLSWLSFLKEWGLGGCLADDMGLGKTIQILALLQERIGQSKGEPFLLVCPTSVISNWHREAGRFTPHLDVMIHHGSGRMTGAKFAKSVSGHDMIITSYGLLHRDIKSIKKTKWSGIILDEAQNIKNPQTKQSQAARAIDAECRFALTGTPVENNVGDLWAIMEFLNPGFLGTQASFKRNFFIPIQLMQDEDASTRLKRATGPFILRRLKTDKNVISDLPEKIESKAYCQLTKEQASLYAATLKTIQDAIHSEEGIKRKGVILSALVKLKQVCNHPAIFLKDNSGMTRSGGKERSGKIIRLTEMLSEVVEAGDSALVFTQFVEMGHMLKSHIQETFGREVLFLHGGTPRKRRDEMVKKFQDADNAHTSTTRIFVISLKAGGTGLNLTAASHVFHFDRWWNPAVEDQATDRAFRIGQKKNVQVHKMICAGTLEEKIDQMIELKKDVSRKVVGTGEGWLTEMSNEDLRNVLALSADAASGTVEAD